MDPKLPSKAFKLANYLAEDEKRGGDRHKLLLGKLLEQNPEFVIQVAEALGFVQGEIPCNVGGINYPVSDRVYQEILRHLRNNQKVEAIKALRAETGLGLKESKDQVEMWQTMNFI